MKTSQLMLFETRKMHSFYMLMETVRIVTTVLEEAKWLQYREISIDIVNNNFEHPLADHDRIKPLGGIPW